MHSNPATIPKNNKVMKTPKFLFSLLVVSIDTVVQITSCTSDSLSTPVQAATIEPTHSVSDSLLFENNTTGIDSDKQTGSQSEDEWDFYYDGWYLPY